MKKTILVLAVLATAFSLTACKNTYNSNGAQVALTQLNPDVYKAEFDVKKEQVNADATVNCLFGWICWGPTQFADYTELSHGVDVGFFASLFPNPQNIAKSAATYNATTPAGYDRLVAATYTTEVEDYFIFKKVTAKVKGFPATVKKIKQVD